MRVMGVACGTMSIKIPAAMAQEPKTVRPVTMGLMMKHAGIKAPRILPVMACVSGPQTAETSPSIKHVAASHLCTTRHADRGSGGRNP